MDFEDYSLDQLRERLCSLKDYISNPSISEANKQTFRRELNEIEAIFKRRLEESLRIYGQTLRPAHLELIARLRAVYSENRSIALIKRAYVASYFGTCFSVALDRPEFTDLRPFFPTLKLPLLIDDSDLAVYEREMYRDIPLSQSVSNFIIDYRRVSRGRPEEYLKKIWLPVLLSVFNSAKLGLDLMDLELIPEFNAKNIETISDLRYFDFAIADRHHGLPILIVEIAANPVTAGQMHKDTRKMTLSMSHILMQLVKRAASHCPNDDFTKFRVFGLLIGGSQFECCVGSVSKNQAGQINFMFNSNDVEWKFDLFQLGEQRGIESSSLCFGASIETSEFVDDTGLSFDRDSLDLHVDLNLYLDEFDQETSNSDEDEDLTQEFVEPYMEAEFVLWKYISLVLKYYADLDLCLKECIQSAPESFSESSLVYQLPLSEVLPSIASSTYQHSGRSAQTTPLLNSISLVAQTQGQNLIYSYLSKFKFQSLPDVVFFNSETKLVNINLQLYLLSMFISEEKSLIDAVKGRVANSYLALVDAKFVMDMLLAAYKVHSLGLVCGCFEPANIGYNRLFFNLNSLPNAAEESKCHEIKANEQLNFDPNYHIKSDSPRFSKRGDLYSIYKCSRFGLINYFSSVLWGSDHVPLLKQFSDLSLLRMGRFGQYPDLDAATILKDVAPIYDEMVKQFADPKIEAFFATQNLALQVLNEISESTLAKRSMESVTRTDIVINLATESKD